MIRFTLPRFGKTRLSLYIGTYQDGSGKTAVEIVTARNPDEAYASVSINIPGVKLFPGEFVIKSYGENQGLFEEMLAAGLIEDTGRRAYVSGWVDLQPVCRLRGNHPRRERQ